ncbi:MAG: hypothetical protein OXB86_03045 [Bdellovibrionales bacterium]|nr:hypothetical protein [Bdellovibrionales bacterium]
MNDRIEENKATLVNRFNEEYFSGNSQKGVLKLLDHGLLNKFVLLEDTIINKLNRYLFNQNQVSWDHLSEDKKIDFLSGLPKDTITAFIQEGFKNSEDYKSIMKAKAVLDWQKQLAKEENQYYDLINPPSGEFSYSDLIRLSTMLVRQPLYEKHFTVNRPPFNIPEKDRPYIAVVPSTDILRQSGIDIQGENGILEDSLHDPKDFFILDSEYIKNCPLSSFSFSDTQLIKDLDECLYVEKT